MKERGKFPRKTTKLSGDRQPSRKIMQNDSEDDLGSWKKNGEDARNVYQRLRRMNRNEQYEQ